MHTNSNISRWLFAVGLLAANPQTDAAGVPSLVKDLSLHPADSSIIALTRVGDTVFFAADDAVHGRELWKTDGTPQGTVLVKDINPGAKWTFPSNQTPNFTELNGVLFFTVDDLTHGLELWKSDGTATGTVMVKDIHPSGHSRPSDMVVSNGRLFFAANDGVHGRELWKTDGTEAGTVLVKDIHPSGDSGPTELFDYNGMLLFSADSGFDRRQLWKSDGTDAGTVSVKIINASGHADPRQMALYDGRVFFSANNGINGTELWSTDGTRENTAMYANIRSLDVAVESTGHSYPSHLAEINGLLYFSAWGDFSSGPGAYWTNGQQHWRTNIHGFAIVSVQPSYPDHYTYYKEFVYFTAGSSPSSVWRTQGTPDTTEGVAAISPVPSQIIVSGGLLYFLSDEIWVSDGTPEGTAPLSEQYPDSRVGVTGEAVELNGAFIAVGFDETHGNELWAYDPDAAGPVLLKDIHSGTTGMSYFGASSGDNPFVDINGVGYFAATSDWEGALDLGNELWKSDGTEAGTSMVKDINPGDQSSNPENFFNINGVLFFTADDGTHGRELWKSDGTEAGTLLVKDITTSNPFDTEFGHFAEVDGMLFFAAKNWSMYSMLWKSDGTDEGTVLVKEIYPGSRGQYIAEMAAFQGLLFFTAMDDNVIKQELWTSDGTEGGTTLFKDISPAGSSSPRELTVVGDTLYFTAEAVSRDRELWKCDGTPEGTVLVKDINPNPPGDTPAPRELISFRDVLFFTADDGTRGQGLWRSDGTETGTIMVADLYPGSRAYQVWQLVAGDDFILFLAKEDPLISSTRLWKSDGTEAGTGRIEITLPDDAEVEYDSINQLTPAQGLVYFTTENEIYGREVWFTDGTNEGTQPLVDLYPGPGDSNPKILGVIGERGTAAETLLFGGDDGFRGNELWKVGGTPGLRLVGLVHAGNGEFSFTFEAVSGRTYTIDRSEDLVLWNTLQSFNDRSGSVTFTDSEALTDYYYYRVTETE